jgi:hypothetical protein
MLNTNFGKSIISLLTLSYSTLSAIKTSINIEDLLEKRLDNTIESGCEITYQDYIKPFCSNHHKLNSEEKIKALNMTKEYVNENTFCSIDNHRLESLIKRKVKEIKK